MRKLTVLLLLAVVVAVDGGWAQLTAQLHSERDNFLLYESIPVVLSIRNFSGRTIELAGTAEKPWLSFVVTDEGGNIVDATTQTVSHDPVLIPPGQTVSRTVDLLPLYELRRRGNFRVQANIAGHGVATSAQPWRFTIMHGRELGTVTVGLPPAATGADEYRTYVLVARPDRNGSWLYALVRNDAQQKVYELVALGPFLSLMVPTMRTDREGNLHVLFQSGPRAFGYAQISTVGRMVERKVYSDIGSPPELATQDGVVRIQGGEQVYPKPEHVLTDEELNPPPPPAPPKKKKHWWQFWSHDPSTNAPAKPAAVKPPA